MVNGFKPATLNEALSLLRDTGAVPYAGGTDLMVENRPGVLSRVTGLISRRGFNIESLSVGLPKTPPSRASPPSCSPTTWPTSRSRSSCTS